MSNSFFTKYDRVAPNPSSDPLSDLIVKSEDITLFKPNSFGMKNFDSGTVQENTLAAVFDLEGFTSFSSQSDPQLFVPKFINEFVKWLFGALSSFSIEEEKDDIVRLFAPLPFFAKYLGDGVLFLWKIDYQGIEKYCQFSDCDRQIELNGDIGNIISILFEVTERYRTEAYPRLSGTYSRVPNRLRCGVAQGLVCSLGNGQDYVGLCINMASRLQKLNGLGLCILKRGIDLKLNPEDKLDKLFVLKKTKIRGSGEELIYVVRDQFEALDKKKKKNLTNP